MPRPRPTSTLFPYTTLFRSSRRLGMGHDYATPTPISCCGSCEVRERDAAARGCRERSPVPSRVAACWTASRAPRLTRSEEHTSELQSLRHLVCRLLLEKKKT